SSRVVSCDSAPPLGRDLATRRRRAMGEGAAIGHAGPNGPATIGWSGATWVHSGPPLAHLGAMRGTALAARVGGGPQGRLMARMPFWCGGTLSYSNVCAGAAAVVVPPD